MPKACISRIVLIRCPVKQVKLHGRTDAELLLDAAVSVGGHRAVDHRPDEQLLLPLERLRDRRSGLPPARIASGLTPTDAASGACT